jgi:bis(5'-nucleosyl)-tetraphosphatase (symmetrical)
MRWCTAGRLHWTFDAKGPPEDARPVTGLMPWFDWTPRTRVGDTRVIFGHWSALGLVKPATTC